MSTPLRSRRRAFVATLATTTLVLFGACTVFNGLSVPDTNGGLDGSLDGAVEAETSTVVDAGAGFLSLEDAVKFCVNAFKCDNLALSTLESIDVPIDTQHFSSCVDWLTGPLPPDRLGAAETAKYLKCAADATTCNDATGCLWLELMDVGDPRCNGVDSGPLTDSGSDPGSCSEDGGDVFFCEGTNPAIFHCSNGYWAPGTKCRKGTDGSHYCDLAGACGGNADCDGGFLSYCSVNGNRLGFDCTLGGFTCGTDSTGDTDCLTNGTLRSCSSLEVKCASDNVSVCDGLYNASYNCVAGGATCDDTYTARCKRPTDTCSPASPGIDTCNGNVISLCAGGQPVSFDCSTIGLTCKAGTGGTTGHCG
ncbi:MAG TPA: hypothetical protein VF407_06405 [Polyangiaceae bacterium]